MSVNWGTGIDWGWNYKGRHDEGVVGGRFQVPRFQTKVRNVKVLGRNVIVDVTVEHKRLHKGSFHPEKGGQGARDWGGTTFRSAGARPRIKPFFFNKYKL